MKKNYIDYENIIWFCYFAIIVVIGILSVLHVTKNYHDTLITVFAFFAISTVIGVFVYKMTMTEENFGRINYILNKKFGTLTQEVEKMDAIVWERSVSEKKCWVSVRLYDKFSGLYTWPYSTEVDPQLWKSMNEYGHVDAECLVTRHLYGGRHHVEGAKVISLSLKK